jgi:hypothetical protein
MQELLFGTWTPQIIAYGQQHPWRILVAVLVAASLVDFIFAQQSPADSNCGDLSGFDFGGGDGDGCGD